jgi:hypothetical protein
MKLSTNFDHREFEKSRKADEIGAMNEMGTTQLSNCTALCEEILQPLRTKIGISIEISSGYRCKAVNNAVGSSEGSHHRYGYNHAAADLQIADKISKRHNVSALKQLYKMAIADNLPFDQMIFEKKYKGNRVSYWLHISHKKHGNNRQMAWTKTIYS